MRTLYHTLSRWALSLRLREIRAEKPRQFDAYLRLCDLEVEIVESLRRYGR
mgnify:CR=1 FL=1